MLKDLKELEVKPATWGCVVIGADAVNDIAEHDFNYLVVIETYGTSKSTLSGVHSG